MTVLRAKVTLHMDNGLPEDDIVNTLYFEGVAPADVDAAAALARITAFYQDIAPDVFPSQMDPSINVKIYDMNDAEPRVPIVNAAFTVAPSAVNALPSADTVCLSFQGPPLSGVNQARRRGRIFIGLVNNSNTNVAQTTSGPRPSGTLMATIADAARDFLGGTAVAQPRWVVYSPTQDALVPGQIGLATTDVTNLWVDDRFDTQRSRKPRVTFKTTRTLAT